MGSLVLCKEQAMRVREIESPVFTNDSVAGKCESQGNAGIKHSDGRGIMNAARVFGALEDRRIDFRSQPEIADGWNVCSAPQDCRVARLTDVT